MHIFSINSGWLYEVATAEIILDFEWKFGVAIYAAHTVAHTM
jgi:hypothetical protein